MKGSLMGMVWSALSLAACSDTDVDPITPATMSDAGSLDATLPDASLGCSEGATQSCACTGGGSGTQTCSNGVFGGCSGCAGGKPKCVAGNYVGEGTGTQRPSLFGDVFAPFEVTRTTKWTFSLEAQGSSEFYTVGNGCIHVIEPEQPNNDTISRVYLSGKVDCTTGILKGEMKGYYTVGSGELGGTAKNWYKGTLEGTFDPDTGAFLETKYETHEPKVILGEQPGGRGTWTAKLTTAEPSRETEAECLIDRFPTERFP